GRTLLADPAVDANNVAALLIDDGVEDHRGLPGLAVADDQLALAAPDRNHAVNRFDARLQRLAHRLAIDEPRGKALERVAQVADNGTLGVERLAQVVVRGSHEDLA